MIDTLSIIGEPKLIGGGGNSKVYECQSDKFPENHKIILKIGGNIEGNIRNFELIKSFASRSIINARGSAAFVMPSNINSGFKPQWNGYWLL